MIFLYRITSEEVVRVATNSNAFDDEDTTYFATVLDPSTPDGQNLVPAKIRDGTTVRNATAPEIATFAAAEATDLTLIDRTSAKDIFDTGSVSKKYLKAIVQVTLDEINTLRGLHSLADRTLAQAKSAINSKIDAGEFD